MVADHSRSQMLIPGILSVCLPVCLRSTVTRSTTRSMGGGDPLRGLSLRSLPPRRGRYMAVATPAAPPQHAERMPIWKRGTFVAWLWIGPALLFVLIFLVYPVLNTIWLSVQNADSSQFVALDNYRAILTNNTMLLVLRNNLLWLVLGTAATVAFGLIIAVLVDRVPFESVAKAAIFIPMAISFVGAGVIWKFVYDYDPRRGLLNAALTHVGGQPQAWTINQPGNNFALIAVYIWMWTGFCMVILSAALKGIPAELLEAARVDGATELQIFFRIIVPLISPTIAVVATT